MPRKNLVKDFRPGTGYHIYSRGFRRLPVFRDSADYDRFMSRLKSLLLGNSRTRSGRTRTFDLSLISYALMPNHFHLYLETGEQADSISQFMRALTPAYAREFSARHALTGLRPVWDGPYRARPVIGAAAKIDLIAYIHLNRSGSSRGEFTSHPNYLEERVDSWLDHERGLRAFGGVEGYRRFVADRERVAAARRAATMFG